jgi:hypothetical protein
MDAGKQPGKQMNNEIDGTTTMSVLDLRDTRKQGG